MTDLEKATNLVLKRKIMLDAQMSAFPYSLQESSEAANKATDELHNSLQAYLDALATYIKLSTKIST